MLLRVFAAPVPAVGSAYPARAPGAEGLSRALQVLLGIIERRLLADDGSRSVSSAFCAVAEAAPTTSTPANPSAKAAKMRMRMSDSSGQEAVMSQRAKRRSLSVPGSCSARSNVGVTALTSLRFRSSAPAPICAVAQLARASVAAR